MSLFKSGLARNSAGLVRLFHDSAYEPLKLISFDA